MTSPFRGISDTQQTRDSEYFRAGRYLAHVNAFKTGQNRKNVPNVAIETTIVAVLDDTKAAKDPQGVHGVGDKASWVQSFSSDNTMPNLKAAVMAMTGVDAEAVNEEFCQELTSEDQPLQGIYVIFDNDMVMTKKGEPFTVVRIKRRLSAEEVLQHVEQDQLDKLELTLDGADE